MSDITQEFISRLSQRYGEFVPPGSLWKELGFSSSASFRKALSQDRIEVHTFELAGRRGSFARAIDVARWQAASFLRSPKKHTD
jgi:hypothetical protein